MTIKQTHSHKPMQPQVGLTNNQATVIALYQLAQEATKKAERAQERYNKAFCRLSDDEVALVIERTGVKGW